MPVYWADTDTIRGAGKSIRGRIADDAGSVSTKLRQLPLEWALPPDKRQSARVVDDVAESVRRLKNGLDDLGDALVAEAKALDTIDLGVVKIEGRWTGAAFRLLAASGEASMRLSNPTMWTSDEFRQATELANEAQFTGADALLDDASRNVGASLDNLQVAAADQNIRAQLLVKDFQKLGFTRAEIQALPYLRDILASSESVEAAMRQNVKALQAERQAIASSRLA